MTNDDATVPQRTVFETQVSIFPPLPGDQELTGSIYDTLTIYIRTCMEALLTSAGLESNVDIIVRRKDIYYEAKITDVIERKMGDTTDGS
jgi:hypothetical protein